MASEHLYTGTCLRCKKEIRAKVKLDRGEPYPVIGAVCDCEAHKPGVTLTLRGPA